MVAERGGLFGEIRCGYESRYGESSRAFKAFESRSQDQRSRFFFVFVVIAFGWLQKVTQKVYRSYYVNGLLSCIYAYLAALSLMEPEALEGCIRYVDISSWEKPESVYLSFQPLAGPSRLFEFVQSSIFNSCIFCAIRRCDWMGSFYCHGPFRRKGNISGWLEEQNHHKALAPADALLRANRFS